MSDPIVFISHNRVKEGKLDDFRQIWHEYVKLIEADKPGTLVYLAYVNEDGTEVTIVHLLPNADALDLLMQGASERAKRAYEFIESDRLEIYGMPSGGVLEMMRKIVGSGVAVSFNPQNLGGFIRPSIPAERWPLSRRLVARTERAIMSGFAPQGNPFDFCWFRANPCMNPLPGTDLLS